MAQKKKSTKKKSADSSPKKYKWTFETFARTLWLKIYPEMCKGFSNGMSHQQMTDLLRQTITPLSGIPLDYCKFSANVHYADFNHDDVVAPSSEKPHAHLAFQFADKLRIGTFFKSLTAYGINIRKCDIDMLQKEGLIFGDKRKSNNGDFLSWVVYGTHETYAAREAEGKHTYDRAEIISNIPRVKIDEMYDTYFEQFDAPVVNDKYIAGLMEHYYNAGFAHNMDFDTIFDANTPIMQVRLNGYKKILRTQYERGAFDYINSAEALNFEKTVIYIYGENNVGKTVTSVKALQSIGYNPYKVKGGGKGKMEQLSVSNDSIVFSDTTVPEILATCEDGANVFDCRYYNRFFFGSVIIITSNDDVVKFYTEHYSPFGVDYGAFRSRIFSIHANADGSLTVDRDNAEYYKRGKVKHKLSIIKKFMQAYEKERSAYVLSNQETDFDLMSDDYISQHMQSDRNIHITTNNDGSFEVSV